MRANPTKGESMRGIVLALRAKISACVITRSREECKEHGDDHYDLGTGGNSILIRKLDLYGLPLPQLHLSYV